MTSNYGFFDTDSRIMNSDERVKRFAIGSEVSNRLSTDAIPLICEWLSETTTMTVTMVTTPFEFEGMKKCDCRS